MNYSNFGELIKALRLSRNWSQSEACEGVCEKRTYIRWEKNEMSPSAYNLHQLSLRFNYDLTTYYKFSVCNPSEKAWYCKQQAEEYIKTQNWVLLWNHIKEMEKIQDFRCGENKETLLYYQALYYFEHKHDFLLAKDTCIRALCEEVVSFHINNDLSKIYSNIGLCLLNCLSISCYKLNEFSLAETILTSIIHNIDDKILPDITFYQSTEFEIKIYATACFNLSLNYYSSMQLELALNTLNNGIDFLVLHNSLYNLHTLYRLKYKVLYSLKQFSEAAKIYCTYIHLCSIRKNYDEIKNAQIELQKDFPVLLEYLPNNVITECVF